MPHGLLRELANKEIMPNMKDILAEGEFGEMESTIPEISSPSWSTIVTGKNPGEHGIYGFTDLIPGSYNLRFPNFNSMKEKPYWETKEGRHIVINVPMTYPAREMNGFMVSGFVAPDLEKSVYPHEEYAALKEMNYRVDVDAGKANTSMKLFLNDLMETNEKRIDLYKRKWGEKWDSFTLIFTGSDRLMHFLWDAYENKNHEHREGFMNYFTRVDEIIGEIARKVDEDDQLVMLSDHGMERLDKDVNINAFLIEEGLLKIDDTKPSYTGIQEGTQAFALEPSRIYINKEGRYPRGSVKPSEEEAVLDSIESIFKNKKFFKKAWRKNEIYHGKEAENGPDMVLMSKNNHNFRGKITKELYSESHLKGKHTHEDAFIFTNKGSLPDKPTVEDALPLFYGERQ